MPTQDGSKIYAGNQRPRIRRSCRACGTKAAIILGKTTVSEDGWTGVSRGPSASQAIPWKLGYNAGASSAGAGAAAAGRFGSAASGENMQRPERTMASYLLRRMATGARPVGMRTRSFDFLKRLSPSPVRWACFMTPH
ncbi:hypothetical protein [Mesorhizobium sp. M0323]|uniref:hypothetical protein n=1 Tax=Mesorhizobium sp. M0323 TaxID=2956938 RepID=UPI00333CE8BE